MKLKLTLFFILLFVMCESICATPDPPMTFGESINLVLEKLVTDGVISLHTGIKPLDRSEIAQALRQTQARLDAGSVELSAIDRALFNKLKREFLDAIELRPSDNLIAKTQLRSEHSSDVTFSPSAKVALRYEKKDSFILHQEFEICQGKNKYPVDGKSASQRLHLWKWDYTADFTRVYLSFALSKFNVLIGRDKLFWGHGYRDSLGISDNSPPFDLVLLSGKFGPIKAQSFMAQLDEMWHDRSEPTPYRYLADRYLAGHRINCKLSDRLEFAVSEIVLYGGDQRGVEWGYFNPILPYYASQHNADWDDNVMFIFDMETIPIDGLRLYGSTSIDDLQYSGEGPNAWGVMLGCHLSGFPSDQADCRIQYSKLNRYVYTHRRVENQYTHFGSIIGHRLGNDSEELFLEFGNYLNADTLVKFDYVFTRQGNASVEDRYWGDDRDLIELPERNAHDFGIQFLYEPIDGWQADLKLGYLFWQIFAECGDDLSWEREIQFEFVIGYGL